MAIEINLKEFLKEFYKRKYTFFISHGFLVILVVIGCLIFYKPYYKSSFTFFINTPSSHNIDLSSYYKLIGRQKGSSLEKQIIELCGSYSLKKYISKDLMDFYSIYKELELFKTSKKYRGSEIELNNFVIDYLALDKNLKLYQTDNNMIIINYKNENLELAHKVLVSFIEGLKTLNIQKNISPNKDIVLIIDPPIAPIDPVKLNYYLVYAVVTIIYLIVFSNIILIRNFHTKRYRSTENK